MNLLVIILMTITAHVAMSEDGYLPIKLDKNVVKVDKISQEDLKNKPCVARINKKYGTFFESAKNYTFMFKFPYHLGISLIDSKEPFEHAGVFVNKEFSKKDNLRIIKIMMSKVSIEDNLFIDGIFGLTCSQLTSDLLKIYIKKSEIDETMLADVKFTIDYQRDLIDRLKFKDGLLEKAIKEVKAYADYDGKFFPDNYRPLRPSGIEVDAKVLVGHRKAYSLTSFSSIKTDKKLWQDGKHQQVILEFQSIVSFSQFKSMSERGYFSTICTFYMNDDKIQPKSRSHVCNIDRRKIISSGLTDIKLSTDALKYNLNYLPFVCGSVRFMESMITNIEYYTAILTQDHVLVTTGVRFESDIGKSFFNTDKHPTIPNTNRPGCVVDIENLNRVMAYKWMSLFGSLDLVANMFNFAMFNPKPNFYTTSKEFLLRVPSKNEGKLTTGVSYSNSLPYVLFSIAVNFKCSEGFKEKDLNITIKYDEMPFSDFLKQFTNEQNGFKYTNRDDKRGTCEYHYKFTARYETYHATMHGSKFKISFSSQLDVVDYDVVYVYDFMVKEWINNADKDKICCLKEQFTPKYSDKGPLLPTPKSKSTNKVEPTVATHGIFSRVTTTHNNNTHTTETPQKNEKKLMDSPVGWIIVFAVVAVIVILIIIIVFKFRGCKKKSPAVLVLP